jgi:hypothetical protein
MNIERIKAWIAALRSEKYLQTTRQLKESITKTEGGTYDRYCCLGVACDLHSKETGNPWSGETYLSQVNLLPYQVVNWLGISSLEGPVFTNYLIALNDFKRYTFEQIADYLEKTYVNRPEVVQEAGQTEESGSVA